MATYYRSGIMKSAELSLFPEYLRTQPPPHEMNEACFNPATLRKPDISGPDNEELPYTSNLSSLADYMHAQYHGCNHTT